MPHDCRFRVYGLWFGVKGFFFFASEFEGLGVGFPPCGQILRQLPRRSSRALFLYVRINTGPGWSPPVANGPPISFYGQGSPRWDGPSGFRVRSLATEHDRGKLRRAGRAGAEAREHQRGSAPPSRTRVAREQEHTPPLGCSQARSPTVALMHRCARVRFIRCRPKR